MTLWFEDVPLNQIHDLGQHRFTADEIANFAQRFAPRQNTHGAAANLHVAAVGHRQMVDALAAQERALKAQGKDPGVSGPSPGGDLLEFPSEVHPGDTISYRLTVTAKRVSGSQPGWGLLFNSMEGVNQRGETVYRSRFIGFSKRRDYRPSLRERLASALTSVPVLRKLLTS